MKRGERFRRGVRELFIFSPAQIRGLLALLLLLAVTGIVISTANRPRFEKSFLELADETGGQKEPRVSALSDTTVQGDGELFFFDPNTVTLQQLCRLGFDVRTAAGIIKYRERGKRFEIAEDFATCYGVSIDDYTRVEPFIRIADEWRPKPPAENPGGLSGGEERQKRAQSPGKFDPNSLDADGFVALGFSPAQADVIIRYRESIGGFRDAGDFSRCYVVSDEMSGRLTPYMVFDTVLADTVQISVGQGSRNGGTVGEGREPRPLEINGADSAALRSVSGIGEVLVVRIMEYRGRLGGFADVSQLAEVSGMYGENLVRIREQIRVDSCEIQKIDVNFAPHKTLVEQMGEHPYVTDRMLRKLLKNRQLKGGWSTIGDMVEENIMTEEEARRLSPYLLFRSE